MESGQFGYRFRDGVLDNRRASGAVRCLPAGTSQHLPVCVDHPCEHLRPADVDTDRDLSVHVDILTATRREVVPAYCVRCKAAGGRSTLSPPAKDDWRQDGLPFISIVPTTMSASYSEQPFPFI